MSTSGTLRHAFNLIVATFMASSTFSQQPALPAFPTLHALPAASAKSSAALEYQWKTSDNKVDFNIEMRGQIQLTDDDKDIKSISDDGYLKISKTVFGSKRSILIESLGGGKFKREYREGRSEMPWEPNGKTWLGEILPELIRTTTIGAEGRVKRIFSTGGTSAVLTEIDRLENDHVKTHYGKLLMKHPVPPNDYATVISRVSGTLGSDHYITDFLKSNVGKFTQTKEGSAAFFTAAKQMESDHYKAAVISEALKGNGHTQENLRIALEAASEMGSDHYITEVLLNLLKQGPHTDAVFTELIKTTNGMESDHYKTTVLTTALARAGLSETAHKSLLEAVKEMGSDHYITQVLSDMLKQKLTPVTVSEVLDVMGSVHSDHYRTEILNQLIARQQVAGEQFKNLLDACAKLEGDHYRTIVLKNAMGKADTDAAVIQVLKATREIDSDHYVTEVLVFAAPKAKNRSADVKKAYWEAAKNISSEVYYGRALKALED